MYDRYKDTSKFITDPEKLRLADSGCVYISGEDDCDIAVDMTDCYGAFDEVKPFIAFLAAHIGELDNAVQRFDCLHGGGFDPNTDEAPFELERISLEKPDTITLCYFCTDVNSEFDAVFEYIDGNFRLRSFGTMKNIPEGWDEGV